MPAVPERFFIADSPPRPAPVTSVTPGRIYLAIEGEDPSVATVELDRAAWVDDGRIVVVEPPEAPLGEILGSEEEARARAAAAGATVRSRSRTGSPG